jgi:hypothetical protein
MPGSAPATPRLVVASGGSLIPRTVADRSYDHVNLLDYVSTALSDNTAGITAAIAAASASGKKLYAPSLLPGDTRYNFTPPLNITTNLTIIGDGCTEGTGVFGSNFNPINYPVLAPALAGTVFRPVSNGQNVFMFAGNGLSCIFEDFGIEFQTPFSNTGDAFNYFPPYRTGTLDYGNGLTGFRFCGIKVFGHDGNHYAINMMNFVNGYIEDFRSYGGGMFFFQNQSAGGGSFGNSVFTHCYGVLFCGGTADAINLLSTVNAGFGRLNALVFLNVQVNVLTYTGAYTAPASAPSGGSAGQYAMRCDAYAYGFVFIRPDFESTQSSLMKIPGAVNNTNGCFFDLTGGSIVNVGIQYAANLVGNSWFPDGTKIKSGTFATGGATSGTFTYPSSVAGAYAHVFFSVSLTGLGGSAWLSATQPSGSPNQLQAFNWACAAGTASITYLAYGC